MPSASSIQIATFVTPLIVLYGLLAHPMNLVFSVVEMTILGLLVLIFTFISQDGETNWLEGVELLVAGQHGFGRVRVPAQQRVHGQIEQGRGEIGHVEQALLEMRELLVEVPEADAGCAVGRRHPNLPVM